VPKLQFEFVSLQPLLLFVMSALVDYPDETSSDGDYIPPETDSETAITPSQSETSSDHETQPKKRYGRRELGLPVDVNNAIVLHGLLTGDSTGTSWEQMKKMQKYSYVLAVNRLRQLPGVAALKTIIGALENINYRDAKKSESTEQAEDEEERVSRKRKESPSLSDLYDAAMAAPPAKRTSVDSSTPPATFKSPSLFIRNSRTDVLTAVTAPTLDSIKKACMLTQKMPQDTDPLNVYVVRDVNIMTSDEDVRMLPNGSSVYVVDLTKEPVPFEGKRVQ
jgi:hypothetical protein